MRHAGRGNSSNCITLAIAGMRRRSTVWCYAQAATKPSTPDAALDVIIGWPPGVLAKVTACELAWAN